MASKAKKFAMKMPSQTSIIMLNHKFQDPFVTNMLNESLAALF